MPKDKYDPPNAGRQHRIMQRNEIAEGKQTRWSEMEIFGERELNTCNLYIYIYIYRDIYIYIYIEREREREREREILFYISISYK